MFEFSLLLQGHGVSLSNDWDDVHYLAEVFHELQVQRPQAAAQEGKTWKGSLFTLLIFHPSAYPSIRASVNPSLYTPCLLPPCSHLLLPIHSALSQKTQWHFSRSRRPRPFQAPQHPKLSSRVASLAGSPDLSLSCSSVGDLSGTEVPRAGGRTRDCVHTSGLWGR